LESGLKLDLNRLARDGFIRPGALTGPIGIVWTDVYTGDEKASGLITADMTGTIVGWFRIQIRQIDQRIDLLADAISVADSGISSVLTCTTWLQFCGCHQVQTHLHPEQDGGPR
jgi:hypothetical protein